MKKVSIILAMAITAFAIEDGFFLGFGFGTTTTESETTLTGNYYSGSTVVGTFDSSETNTESGSTAEIYIGYRWGDYQFAYNSGSIATQQYEDSTSEIAYSLLAGDYFFSKEAFKPYVGAAIGQSTLSGKFTINTTDYTYEATSPAFGPRVGFVYDMKNWSLGLRYQMLITNPQVDDSLTINNVVAGVDFVGDLKSGYNNFTSTMFTANYHF